jgi:hypothetical protein
LCQLGHELRVTILAAELFIHAVVIDNVVPMSAPLRGLQIGRAIHVRHSEFGQIGSNLTGIIESKACM